jgi:hypothetical protein
MELTGLRELLVAMRKVAPDAKRELSTSLKAIGKMVVTDAQGSMSFKHPTGRAKRAFKVKVVTRRGFEGVEIAEGGAVAPYLPWLDFGGTVGRGRRSTARVSIHGGGRVTVKRVGSRGSGSVVRPYIKDGRYLYPAYFRRFDDMVQATFEAVRAAATSAGLAVASR